MAHKPYKSKELDEIRQKIDALDTRIHETLRERAELVLQIGEEKRKNNIEIVQPAREARMIRRLLSKHSGVLPEMAVVRIWRELVGAVSLLQTGLKVVVANDEEHPEYWDLAKDYFGSCLPMSRTPTNLTAIAAVREGKANFAVLPWPKDQDENPWWDCLGSDTDDSIQVIVRLPHGDDPSEPNPDKRALVVAKAGFDESGEDRSFLMIDCEERISRARVASKAEEAGLKPLSISTKHDSNNDQDHKHLLEVDGYITQDGKDVEALRSLLGEEGVNITCIGGYPVPCQYSKTIAAQESVIPAAPKAAE
ncbi:MAG: chorismate mutase [Alphaproteobacteria bacterium]|nr:chorismate mutase [Alphaproteobacteria bacterium]